MYFFGLFYVVGRLSSELSLCAIQCEQNWVICNFELPFHCQLWHQVSQSCKAACNSCKGNSCNNNFGRVLRSSLMIYSLMTSYHAQSLLNGHPRTLCKKSEQRTDKTDLGHYRVPKRPLLLCQCPGPLPQLSEACLRQPTWFSLRSRQDEVKQRCIFTCISFFCPHFLYCHWQTTTSTITICLECFENFRRVFILKWPYKIWKWTLVNAKQS